MRACMVWLSAGPALVRLHVCASVVWLSIGPALARSCVRVSVVRLSTGPALVRSCVRVCMAWLSAGPALVRSCVCACMAWLGGVVGCWPCAGQVRSHVCVCMVWLPMETAICPVVNAANATCPCTVPLGMRGLRQIDASPTVADVMAAVASATCKRTKMKIGDPCMPHGQMFRNVPSNAKAAQA